MFDTTGFTGFFLGQGKKPSSLNNYLTVLKRVDTAMGGLDERLVSEGPVAVERWAVTTTAAQLKPYLKDVPSITRKYIEFYQTAPRNTPDEVGQTGETPERVLDTETSAFQVEREMQRAVRKQLGSLEPGLTEADGGFEFPVPTGRIDILARDGQGQLVVIELKPGVCPAGTLEQALGYAADVEDREGKPARTIVIAQSFPERVRAAAKKMRDLELRTYEFSLRFQTVE